MEKLKIKGEPVKLVVYDTRGDNAEAINLTRKLIHSDKVLLVLGPFFSAECEVAFPIANQGKTPIITAAAAKPGIAAKNRPYAFRMALTSDKLNGPLVDRWQAANKGQIKKVVILTDTKDAFTKADGTAGLPRRAQGQGHRGDRQHLVPDGRHRLLGAGHQGEGAEPRRHRGRRPLQRGRQRRPRDPKAGAASSPSSARSA